MNDRETVMQKLWKDNMSILLYSGSGIWSGIAVCKMNWFRILLVTVAYEELSAGSQSTWRTASRGSNNVWWMRVNMILWYSDCSLQTRYWKSIYQFVELFQSLSWAAFIEWDVYSKELCWAIHADVPFCILLLFVIIHSLYYCCNLPGFVYLKCNLRMAGGPEPVCSIYQIKG